MIFDARASNEIGAWLRTDTHTSNTQFDSYTYTTSWQTFEFDFDLSMMSNPEQAISSDFLIGFYSAEWGVHNQDYVSSGQWIEIDNVSIREVLSDIDDSTYTPYDDFDYWGVENNFYPDFDKSCVGLIFISDSSNTTLKRDCLIELNMGDVEDTDSIVDTSGNSNIGLLIGDYTIRKESTLVPLTRDSEMKLPETDNTDKAI